VSDGNDACFPEGTRIKTASGFRNIEDLNAGDRVSAVDVDRKAIDSRRVLKVCGYDAKAVYVLALDNFHSIEVTASHSFRSLGRWVRADRLQAGDDVEYVSAEGRTLRARVTRSLEFVRYAPVYNLIVEGNFTFIAGDFVVHSFTNARGLRVLAWKCLIPVRAIVREAVIFARGKAKSRAV